MKTVAKVVTPSGVFDYAIPDELRQEAQIGVQVVVPLHKKKVKGLLLSLESESAFPNLKPLEEIVEKTPLLPQDLFDLALWLSKYYVSSLHQVFPILGPPSARKERSSQRLQKLVRPLVSLETLRETCQQLRARQGAQAKVLDVLLLHPRGILLSLLKERAAVSSSPIETLAREKLIELVTIASEESLIDQEFFRTKPKTLSPDQQRALDQIDKSLAASAFQVHLLHGITGSGKTEVYLQAIDHTLQKGQGVIFLVPEIALTPQTMQRLKARFPNKIALLHHRLSPGERYRTWRQIREGQIPLVVGARSALFSPLPHLGLLIVDEEHESSYKNQEAPRYHARDVAVMRGRLCRATVILGSATPSLESYTNALEGKYLLSTLSSRADKATLPTTMLINMASEKEKKNRLFSEPLIDGIKKRMACGEQTLLFLNRRGYQTSAQCTECAHILRCPHCEMSLTYHLKETLLACHLCNYHLEPPRRCPSCLQETSLKYKGAGTEMVERALHALLPEVRTLRLDADTTRHKGSHEQILRLFRTGKADVLIGTQMIAKGLHLPLVTLVGVIGVDGALSIPDFRASETIFQLLTQVAGRSGRGGLAGEVLIQTHLPSHPVLNLAATQDYIRFYQEEIEMRKLFNYPPFTHLVKLTFSGKDKERLFPAAEKFRKELIDTLPPSVEIQPIIPCGYAKIKGLFRLQCLLKTGQISPLLPYLRAQKRQSHFELTIDIDPTTTYF